MSLEYNNLCSKKEELSILYTDYLTTLGKQVCFTNIYHTSIENITYNMVQCHIVVIRVVRGGAF